MEELDPTKERGSSYDRNDEAQAQPVRLWIFLSRDRMFLRATLRLMVRRKRMSLTGMTTNIMWLRSMLSEFSVPLNKSLAFRAQREVEEIEIVPPGFAVGGLLRRPRRRPSAGVSGLLLQTCQMSFFPLTKGGK